MFLQAERWLRFSEPTKMFSSSFSKCRHILRTAAYELRKWRQPLPDVLLHEENLMPKASPVTHDPAGARLSIFDRSPQTRFSMTAGNPQTVGNRRPPLGIHSSNSSNSSRALATKHRWKCSAGDEASHSSNPGTPSNNRHQTMEVVSTTCSTR